MTVLEKKAANVETAIEEGLAELQVSKNDVDIEIVSKGGLLKKACVRISVKPRGTEAAEVFLQKTMELMGLDCKVNVEEDDEECVLRLTGEDNGAAIGYRGDALDSLQYLCLLIANKNGDVKKRIVVDAENYREKRAETLSKLARRIARDVAKTGRERRLEPMNPFERRVIHTALQDDRFVITESAGDEPRRYVVIKPKERPRYERKERTERYDEPDDNIVFEPSEYNAEPETVDMYDPAQRNAFKKTGGGKTRSFGNKKKYF